MPEPGMEQLLAAAEKRVLLRELEQMVIDEEVKAGLSIPGAVRPLFAHEVGAQVRFAELDSAEQEAVKEVEDVFTWLDAVMVAGIVGAFRAGKTYTAATAADVFIGLAAAQPRPVRRAVKSAIGKLALILAKAHTTAGKIVLAEAARQGVTDLPPAPPINPAKFRGDAAAAAAYHWPRLTHAVAKDVLQPGAEDITRDTITKTAEKVGTAGAQDTAKQGVHHAGGTGRTDTANELPIDKIWASELLDGQGCDLCGAIDGQEYDTLADALLDYPHGYMDSCRGGARCRGTLVFQYKVA